MFTAGLIIFIFIIFTIIINKIFEKKYNRTKVAIIFKKIFRINIYLIPLVWIIFVYDAYHVQNTNKHAGLDAFFTIIFSPFLVVVVFYIWHIFFITLFMIIDSFLLKIIGTHRKFNLSIFLTIFILCIGADLLWWTYFYSEGSILVRVIVWNATILFLPWVSIAYVIKNFDLKDDRKT